MTTPARVLLVEDDPSIRRFVALALEESPIELLQCTSVAQALERLAEGGVALVITDLMLPGESGMGLVQRLAEAPALRRGALVAVYSAGITPTVREQLESMHVWRILSKPTSVLALDACVREALAAWQPVGAQSAVPAAAVAMPADAMGVDEAAAVATHFAGNAALFTAYRASCLAQFPHDIEAGDTAVQAGDAHALRRLAHSLGTVLLTLGRPGDSVLARALESAAQAQGLQAAAPLWTNLRQRLAPPGH